MVGEIHAKDGHTSMYIHEVRAIDFADAPPNWVDFIYIVSSHFTLYFKKGNSIRS